MGEGAKGRWPPAPSPKPPPPTPYKGLGGEFEGRAEGVGEPLGPPLNKEGATLKQQIIVSGLGGQGALTVTRLLAEAAAALGLEVITSETHGMAQRGGTVISMVKVGPFRGPLIPAGAADVGLFLAEKNLGVHRGLSGARGPGLRQLRRARRLLPGGCPQAGRRDGGAGGRQSHPPGLCRGQRRAFLRGGTPGAGHHGEDPGPLPGDQPPGPPPGRGRGEKKFKARFKVQSLEHRLLDF